MNPTDRREQRLQSYKKARSEKEIYKRVLAPTLYEFVVWVLQKALQSGKKRLYFLARDGYQMYLAARQLCKQYDLDIECRYLKVSRYAVRVPEYHLLGERCLERICVGGIDVTFEKIMQRAALTDKEAGEIAALAGYMENYRKVINYHEVMQLKDRLKKIPLLFHYIDSHSKEAYGTAIGYLTQEGLLEQVPYALVDSGWIGTIQQSIEHLLRQKQPDRKLEGYYFGLYEIPEGERKENYHSFYFTPWGEIKRKVHFSNSLFEAEAYGSLLFSDDVREDNNQKVSADFSEQEIKNHHLLNRLLIMTGVRKKVLHESAWIEGSIATCRTLNERGRARNRWHAVFYKYIIYMRKWIKQNMIHGK